VRRLFFALWPDTEASERLAAELAPRLAAIGVEGVTAPDLHVTLCFLGLVDQAQAALLVQRAGVLDAPGFQLRLDTLEYWGAAQVLVLEAGSVPGAALALAGRLAAVARECGCVPDRANWRAHMTLARRVPPTAAQLPGWPVVPGRGPIVRLAAQHFFLVQSLSLAAADSAQPGAPRYRRLHQWPLRSPGD
jgi:RNA 2',3'-cyclic 3'-phosphodiesterase